jgi:hypothetical protein
MPWMLPTACAADSLILQVDVTRKSNLSTLPVEDTNVLLPSNVIVFFIWFVWLCCGGKLLTKRFAFVNSKV